METIEEYIIDNYGNESVKINGVGEIVAVNVPLITLLDFVRLKLKEQRAECVGAYSLACKDLGYGHSGEIRQRIKNAKQPEL